MSDALPKNPIVITDIKGSGDPVNLRSVSCNDIASVNNGTCEIPNETNKNLSNHVMNYAQSITNVSVSMASIKPGIIIARSSEIISKIIEDKSMDQTKPRPWTSLCTIPSQANAHSLSSPNKVHPFSGLLTSQLICTECEWKVNIKVFENVAQIFQCYLCINSALFRVLCILINWKVFLCLYHQLMMALCGRGSLLLVYFLGWYREK